MAAWRTLVLLALVTVLPSACSQSRSAAPATIAIEIAGEVFELEVAADGSAREKGLMGRTELDAHGGMIFIFPDVGLRSFWMKNCLMDIDVMFLDASGRVTAMHTMIVEPPQRHDETETQYELRLIGYRSAFPAQFAIELQPGSLDRLNIRVEDKIELDLDRLKAYAR